MERPSKEQVAMVREACTRIMEYSKGPGPHPPDVVMLYMGILVGFCHSIIKDLETGDGQG